MAKSRNMAPESKKSESRASDPNRRSFLAAAVTGVAVLTGFPRLLRAAHHAVSQFVLPKATQELLASSPYVYISPLKSDGEESRCHGEVWYAWLDGAVVVTVAADRWKARALKSGLDRARVWVGDHGRWKGVLSNNEDFRQAPSFVARAEQVKEEQVLEQLLAAYEKKYPKEIERWRDRMRSGYHDGSRILIRYVPEASTQN
jgi:hypothetical protein